MVKLISRAISTTRCERAVEQPATGERPLAIDHWPNQLTRFYGVISQTVPLPSDPPCRVVP